MPTRRLILLVVAAATSTVVSGCSSAGNPYAELSVGAAEYVIPESESWGSGELCPDDGDCGGSITVEEIERFDWYRIIGLDLPSGGSSDGTVTASLDIEEARAASDPGRSSVQVRVWGPDAGDVRGLIDDGFDVWAGVDPALDYAVVFIAFDARGRVAAIGNAAAEYFTIPVAELAAQADASSAFLYLDPLMSR